MRVNLSNLNVFSANRQNPFANTIASKASHTKASASGNTAEAGPEDKRAKEMSQIKKELSELSKKKNPTKADRIRQRQLQQKLAALQKQEDKESRQVSDIGADSEDETDLGSDMEAPAGELPAQPANPTAPSVNPTAQPTDASPQPVPAFHIDVKV